MGINFYKHKRVFHIFNTNGKNKKFPSCKDKKLKIAGLYTEKSPFINLIFGNFHLKFGILIQYFIFL